MNPPRIFGHSPLMISAFESSVRSCHLILPRSWKFRVPQPYGLTILLLSISLSLHLGCGAVGKPIPPEDVGIEAKKRKQEREAGIEQDQAGIEEPIPATEQPEELPPFFPIGGR